MTDATIAAAFYFDTLGLTNDPWKQQTMSKTIWANIGTQQVLLLSLSSEFIIHQSFCFDRLALHESPTSTYELDLNYR